MLRIDQPTPGALVQHYKGGRYIFFEPATHTGSARPSSSTAARTPPQANCRRAQPPCSSKTPTPLADPSRASASRQQPTRSGSRCGR